MSVLQNTNAAQNLRDTMRARLYYFQDAWAYIHEAVNRVDDRIHPGTWRQFTPRAGERVRPQRRNR